MFQSRKKKQHTVRPLECATSVPPRSTQHPIKQEKVDDILQKTPH